MVRIHAGEPFSGRLEDYLPADVELRTALRARPGIHRTLQPDHSRFRPHGAKPGGSQVQANYAPNPNPELPVSDFRLHGGLLFADAGNRAW